MPVIPLGACLVAEAAELAGHDVRVLDLMFERNPLHAVEQEISNTGPDVIGLSVRNLDNNDIRNPAFFIRDIVPLVNTIRRATTVPIILGGAALAVMPEEIMRYTRVSYAVLGEGEVVFPHLLENLAKGISLKQAPGVAWIEDDIFGKNELSGASCTNCPAPDFPRWINAKAYQSGLATVPLQTKLGCHFKCIYCTYRKIEGPHYRLFNHESILEAIERFASAGFRDIEFVDNVFNSPYANAMTLCEALAQRSNNVRLQSLELNPLFVDDALLGAMESAGFTGIGITVENASDAVLCRLGKGFTARDVYNAAEVVKRHRLPCVWIFMLGGPGETESTVRDTLRFAESSVHPRDVVFFNLGIRIYPGTELESVARTQGILTTSPRDMLTPVFYMSPEVDFAWMVSQIKNSMSSHLNFMNSDSIGMSFLPLLHRIGYKMGIRPPLWKHTRIIRRGLRLFGIDS